MPQPLNWEQLCGVEGHRTPQTSNYRRQAAVRPNEGKNTLHWGDTSDPKAWQGRAPRDRFSSRKRVQDSDILKKTTASSGRIKANENPAGEATTQNGNRFRTR